MPAFINTATIQIINAAGETENVPNPFLRYNFQQFPMNPEYFPTSESLAPYDYYLANRSYTVRWPDTIGGPSDYNTANAALENVGLQESVVSCALFLIGNCVNKCKLTAKL